jgi:hypothetical protein
MKSKPGGESTGFTKRRLALIASTDRRGDHDSRQRELVLDSQDRSVNNCERIICARLGVEGGSRYVAIKLDREL